MSRRVPMRLLPRALLLLAGTCVSSSVFAKDLLIRNATVLTAAARGSL